MHRCFWCFSPQSVQGYRSLRALYEYFSRDNAYFKTFHPSLVSRTNPGTYHRVGVGIGAITPNICGTARGGPAPELLRHLSGWPFFCGFFLLKNNIFYGVCMYNLFYAIYIYIYIYLYIYIYIYIYTYILHIDTHYVYYVLTPTMYITY